MTKGGKLGSVRVESMRTGMVFIKPTSFLFDEKWDVIWTAPENPP
jgi:hypothetical protein